MCIFIVGCAVAFICIMLYVTLRPKPQPQEKSELSIIDTMDIEAGVKKYKEDLQKQTFDLYIETLKVQYPELTVSVYSHPDYHFKFISYSLDVEDLSIGYVGIGEIGCKTYKEAKEELVGQIAQYKKYRDYFEEKYKKQPQKIAIKKKK